MAPLENIKNKEKRVSAVLDILDSGKDKILELYKEVDALNEEEAEKAFDTLKNTTVIDLQYLIELEEKTGEESFYITEVGGRKCLMFNEGGMGTGVSGFNLAKSILLAGGLARIASIAGGRYLDGAEDFRDNPEVLFIRLAQSFSWLKQQVGQTNLNLYDLLDLSTLSEAEEMRSKKGKEAKEDYERAIFKAADVIAVVEQIRQLRKIPETLGRGMLGINIMKKTEAYERMIKVAALAFSGLKEGERSDGLVTLSAGVGSDVLKILTDLKEQIPNIQIPHLDTVVSSGFAFSAFMRQFAKSDLQPSLITVEGLEAGGHLGGDAGAVKDFSRTAHQSFSNLPEKEKENREYNFKYVINSLLEEFQKKEYLVPISFASALNLDTEKQKEILDYVKTKSAELRIDSPTVLFQLGTPFASAAEGDASNEIKLDQIAAAYEGDKPALKERRERNRRQFVGEIKKYLEIFKAELEKNNISELKRKSLEYRIQEGEKALDSIQNNDHTIVFDSTVGFKARAVPNETLGKIIMGVQMRQNPCRECLTDCALQGFKNKEVIDASKIFTIKTDFGNIQFAEKGFCIEETLHFLDEVTGQLVFRGDGYLSGNIQSAISVIADNISGLVPIELMSA